MIGSEFITNWKDKCGKKISDIEMGELLDLLSLLDDNEIQSLYDYMKYNYNSRAFPTIPQIRGYMQALGFTRGGQVIQQNLHPQSPYRMIHEGEKMSCEEIVKYCRAIRASYDAGQEVSGRRLSFLANWEHITSVDESDREVVKSLILEGDREALHSFLEAAVKKVPINEIKIERQGKMVNMGVLMNQLRRGA